LQWRFTDTGEEYSLTLQNGVLTHRAGAPAGAVDAVVSVERGALNEFIVRTATLEELGSAGRFSIDGDVSKLGELLGLLDPPDPTFAIVTPRR
jgi:alkyl sulfatase BDS1-like metallo-beta-lactamase superfamily hydrolase